MKQTESIDENPKTVVFRKAKHTGHILALFPLVPSATKSGQCYVRVHGYQDWGSADYEDIINATVEATPEEYAALYERISTLGHSMKVRVHEELTRPLFASNTVSYE